MRKNVLIALSNIRKSKGQTASIIVLIIIASLMLNLWLMLSMDYKKNFERYHEKFNAEHVTLAVDGDTVEFQRFLSQTLEGDDRTAEYSLDHCRQMDGMFSYNGGEVITEFVFLEKQAALTRSIGRIEIVEEGSYESGVYLPMLYKTDDIVVGKTIDISIGSHKETYTVCGFFNSIMMGSHNCALTEIVLTEDKYAELESSEWAPRATLCSVRLKDISENLNYEASLKAAVSEQQPNINMMSNCYDIVWQSRYISQMICSGIMSAMAFFVLLIALVVIVSNIVNYIQVNMKEKSWCAESHRLYIRTVDRFIIITVFKSDSVVGSCGHWTVIPFVSLRQRNDDCTDGNPLCHAFPAAALYDFTYHSGWYCRLCCMVCVTQNQKD